MPAVLHVGADANVSENVVDVPANNLFIDMVMFYFLCLCKESNKENTADFDAELSSLEHILSQNRR